VTSSACSLPTRRLNPILRYAASNMYNSDSYNSSYSSSSSRSGFLPLSTAIDFGAGASDLALALVRLVEKDMRAIMRAYPRFH
jgi:hypothetical protein